MAQAGTRSVVRRTIDRFRRDGGVRLLTLLVMIAFVVLVYLVVVVGPGVVTGRTSPSLWLSVGATAIVAIAFEPVRRRVSSLLAGVLHQERISPYQVLARFPATVTGLYPAEELPMRMATVLAQGTGALRAEVWLMVHDRLTLAATWPAGPTHQTDQHISAQDTPPDLGSEHPATETTIVVDGSRHSLAVRERGETLGALTVVLGADQQLTAVEERLFAGLAAQSGLMLRVAGLRAELEQQLQQLQRRGEELRQARRDLLTRQDAERQRLERNIHDGAQQEVIAVLVNLRLVQTLLGRSPARARALLAEQSAAAGATIDTLDELSRGLYPRLLTEAGPVAALDAAVASGPIRVEVTATDVPRCTPAVEAAIYFCCLEAVQNATKHSSAAHIRIEIIGQDIHLATERIELAIHDDGRGFDVERPYARGLANIRDRIESVQGRLTIVSDVGHGTTIRAVIPLAAGVPACTNPDSHADEPPRTDLQADHRLPSAPMAGR